MHDYLITNADFDYEMFEKSYIPEYGYDAYSILVEGIGISDGFSNAMSLLLNMCNIENMWVYGFLAGEADGAHTWNIAKIGDYYYHIDVTFDDMLSIGDSISYRYFCLSDNQIAIDHVWGAYTDLYPCVMDNPDIMVY